jgi:hypothetical protein
MQATKFNEHCENEEFLKQAVCVKQALSEISLIRDWRSITEDRTALSDTR